ncbi:MAG TPA: hypothetical protein VMB48_06700 [Steroidobacteraceae bacterium]|nr:hypothetical protein [Steroidobacteraceae bacterium]
MNMALTHGVAGAVPAAPASVRLRPAARQRAFNALAAAVLLSLGFAGAQGPDLGTSTPSALSALSAPSGRAGRPADAALMLHSDDDSAAALPGVLPAAPGILPAASMNEPAMAMNRRQFKPSCGP